MQMIHRELIALMPNAVERPCDGQLAIRHLESWDDCEAARVTLERFGESAISYRFSVEHLIFIDTSGVIQPAKLILLVEFKATIGRKVVRFYNHLPANMLCWRSKNAKQVSGQTSAGGSTVSQAVTEQVGFENFIEELEQNNIRLMLLNGHTNRYQERQPSRWSVPVYDFGGLVQPTMPDYLGDELIDRLLQDAPRAPEPPSSAVVFLQRFKIPAPQNPNGPINATLLLRVEGLTANGEPNVTFAAQHQTNWVREDNVVMPEHWQTLEPKLMAANGELLRSYRLLSAKFIAMLAGWRENIDIREANSVLTAKTNLKRRARRQAPIMATKVIHICTPPVRTKATKGNGLRKHMAHASPHEHVRKICEREISYNRNGKQVRYLCKKAGQKVSVSPHGAINPLRAVATVQM